MPQQPPLKTPISLHASQWCVYIIRNRNGDLYTGITTDPQRRLAEHRGKAGKGAKSLRGKAPLQIVWHQNAQDRSEASRLEYRIKQLTKVQKENLIAMYNTEING